MSGTALLTIDDYRALPAESKAEIDAWRDAHGLTKVINIVDARDTWVRLDRYITHSDGRIVQDVDTREPLTEQISIDAAPAFPLHVLDGTR